MAAKPKACEWPDGCDRPAKPKADPSSPGPSPKYCFKLGHTTVNATRLRRQQEGEDRSHGLAPGTHKNEDGLRKYASGGAGFTTDSPRLVQLISGELNVEDLDDEELARGYPKDRNGRFTGRPPRMIPLILHKQIQRVFFARIEEAMRKALPDAVAMLATVATNPTSEDRDRLKAIDMLLTRIMGKPPEKIQISTGEKPFEMTVGKMRRAKPAAPPEPEEAE